MLPVRIFQMFRSPIQVQCRYLQSGGQVPADQFSPSQIPRTHAQYHATMASADFPGHFLPGISPDKSVLLPDTTAAFTSVVRPMGFAVLCQLTQPHRPYMRFLSVGPPVSASLPPPARLPLRSWLHVVVITFSRMVLLQGTCTPFTTRPCWAYTRQMHNIHWGASLAPAEL